MYRRGISTKNRIITVAKELFRQKGYKDASVNEICNKSDTKLGTFTYYFPKKTDLLSTLYTEYMQKCIDYIDSHNSGFDPFKHHLYSVMLYYMNLYSDEEVVRFHKEVMEIASMNQWFHNPRLLVSEFSGGADRFEDDRTFDLYVKADNAVRRELNIDFINQPDHSPQKIKALVVDIYTINAKMFDVDLDKVIDALNDAYTFAIKNHGGNISLL
ncbi:MAG: TetR/AcrR family transcriptional regulator [Solobacterium sp.]|nr:TetR/AcrR family transcriptional regulator [Solobacterium sp.]